MQAYIAEFLRQREEAKAAEQAAARAEDQKIKDYWSKVRPASCSACRGKPLQRHQACWQPWPALTALVHGSRAATGRGGVLHVLAVDSILSCFVDLGLWHWRALQVSERDAAEAARKAARQSAADRIYDKLRLEKEAQLRAQEEEEYLINLMREEEAAEKRRQDAERAAAKREASKQVRPRGGSGTQPARCLAVGHACQPGCMA